jgi:hypothetical protein
MIFFFALATSLVATPLDIEVELEGSPVAKQNVEIVGFRQGEQVMHEEKITDAHGRVRFEVRPGEYNLIVRSIYDGIPYFSEGLFAGQLPKQVVKMRVYRAAETNEHVRISDLRLFISASREDVMIEEEILISNPTKTSLKGKTTPQGPEVFRLNLPANSHDLRFTAGFAEDATRFEGNDIISGKPLSPGTNRFGFRYAVEKSAMSAQISFKLPYPVEQVSLASSAAGTISGIPLTKVTQKYLDEQMVPTYEAKLNGEQEFQLHLTGLPLKYRNSQVLPAVLLIVFCITILGLARRSKPTTVTDNRDELLQKYFALSKLKQKSLIDEVEFQRRRYVLLERLCHFYE